MKAAILTGIGKLEIKEVPVPTINGSEVLIKVRACGICGSDLFVYKIGPFREDQILGHEFTGDIESVGRDVTRWKKGDKVVINPTIPCRECCYCKEHNYNICDVYGVTGVTTDGAYAEYVKVPEYQLYEMPKELGYEEGTFLQPMSSALHSVTISKMRFGDTVVVFGAGPSGLLAMLWAKAFGAEKVIAIEVAESRIAVAKSIADIVINAYTDDVMDKILKITDNMGPRIVIECSGNPKAQEQAIDIVRKGGCIVLYGIPHESTSINFQSVIRKEITLQGSINGHESAYSTSIQAVKSNKINTSAIPIMKVNLDNIGKAFERLLTGEAVRGVVVF